MESLRFVMPALTACLLLASIHVYLGHHVITRGVIFVDLALAQIAALGALVAAAQGHEPGTLASYLHSLGFAILGALVFSLTGHRHHGERVPQEATIGIVYAVSASAVVLIASRLAHGSDEIERMLVGNILWVTWPTIARTALLFAAVGAFHVALRRPFLEISSDPQGAHARGRPVRLYDFLFYASFAVVITSAVSIAGVLLVFAFLVVPSVAGVMLAERLAARLAIGFVVAVLASGLGIAGSWSLDLPTGAAIVTSFGLLLALVAATQATVRWARSR